MRLNKEVISEKTRVSRREKESGDWTEDQREFGKTSKGDPGIPRCMETNDKDSLSVRSSRVKAQNLLDLG